jgi:hypothetical protein
MTSKTLTDHGLKLEAVPNDERDCSDVWVESNDHRGYSSSYAVAVNEGTLDNYVGDSMELRPDQLEWLNGQVVRDWLDSVNY